MSSPLTLLHQTCVELFKLYRAGKVTEAQSLQLQVAASELGLGTGGINGTKWVVCKLRGYPDSSTACRRPYPLFTDKARQDMIMSQMLLLQDVEMRLANDGKA